MNKRILYRCSRNTHMSIAPLSIRCRAVKPSPKFSHYPGFGRGWRRSPRRRRRVRRHASQGVGDLQPRTGKKQPAGGEEESQSKASRLDREGKIIAMIVVCHKKVIVSCSDTLSCLRQGFGFCRWAALLFAGQDCKRTRPSRSSPSPYPVPGAEGLSTGLQHRLPSL